MRPSPCPLFICFALRGLAFPDCWRRGWRAHGLHGDFGATLVGGIYPRRQTRNRRSNPNQDGKSVAGADLGAVGEEWALAGEVVEGLPLAVEEGVDGGGGLFTRDVGDGG